MEITIIIRIIIVLLSGLLFWIGGKWWHNARRFIMPTMLSIFMCLYLNTWLGLTTLLMIAPLCLGYGDKSPLRHIFGDGWGRGVWGLLVALGASLGLVVTGFIALPWYILYLALNFTLENVLKKLPQDIADPIIGCSFGLIVFLI